MVFGSRSERIVLSTGGSPPLPGFGRMMGEGAGKDEPATDGAAKDGAAKDGAAKDEPAKDGAVGRGGRHRGQPAAGWSELPPDLPRETVFIELPPERREGLRLVGHVESERPVHRREYVVQLVRRARHVRADSPSTARARRSPGWACATGARHVRPLRQGVGGAPPAARPHGVAHPRCPVLHADETA